MINEIESYLRDYFGIKGSDQSDIGNLFEYHTLERQDFLLRTGQYSRALSFLKNGYLRVYATDDRGDKEITQWISTPGSFVADLSSFIFDIPARWNIQALTHCELYTITQEHYRQIDTVVNNWGEIEKRFLVKCFVTLEQRVFQQISMSAEEKYQALFEMNPDMFNRVPLQYIASMLGMSPETLSRIRRKRTS